MTQPTTKMLIPMIEVTKHHIGNIENELTAKAISISSITASVKRNGVPCRYQPENDIFKNR